ncbi:LysR family transcriptional regulator [Rhizobium brockwellii]|jgi:DNA-binding transcriptional LysR family regulator|uniref:LysR family transcriptional regulator n=2 Tax=Rhizobium TaxID=379 RepID=A0ABU3YKX4_9HYPH|nr:MULTISPECIES: LysR family transcriptional regulator [Rhizobium]KPN22494.1 LysR family transcriptional regulator [Rhizobium brockwellii]MDV4156613.1 LysR family transcriptional regulator [Rhizobium brockwellii]MDV4179205.1 LysR family transcriptional regulator [Rhizobium brockwellii]MDV4186485.1 LysR family transcriptional regulator [Rhizobium brockwellii]NZD53252.1 LysR family transcriptional regulator [Rhizobium leguminosarum]
MALEIDPKKLLYFAAVIEQGSLNRAARQLSVSQPALSTSMDRLEAELGMQLLERGPKGIVATRKGDILYCHARLIREEIQLAERDLLNADDCRSESIRIGSLPSLASKIVPMALSKWRETHEGGHLEVVENAQVDLLTGLLRRDFDFVIGFTKVFDMLDGLRQRVLFRDTLRVIAGINHPLRELETLTWGDLVKYPWISPTSRRTHTVLDHIMQTMDAPLPQITVCGSVSLLKSLVAETEHLALLPAHAVREEVAEQRLYELPFFDPTLNRDIAVFFREGYVMDQPRKDLVACVTEVGMELCRDKKLDEVPA